ncbi:GDP/GTP exchange factor for ARF, partial [Lunasporangiospora selenospora]
MAASVSLSITSNTNTIDNSHLQGSNLQGSNLLNSAPLPSPSATASLTKRLTAQKGASHTMLNTGVDDFPICELHWSHLVHAEIISVTSAMRRNSRWSGMSVSGLSMGSLGMNIGLRGREQQRDGTYRNQESPLMVGFNELRSRLATTHDVKEMDAAALLDPFLEVIRSGDTNGPITGAALSSIEKFLMYRIIDKDSLNVAQAMQRLAVAATHCKFEASDSVSDEIVLLKILQVLRVAMTSGPGDFLTDESVCSMIETGLSMCCQLQLSEMLRKAAENTMTVITRTMFEKLRTIPIPPEATFDESEDIEGAETIHVQTESSATDGDQVNVTINPSAETFAATGSGENFQEEEQTMERQFSEDTAKSSTPLDTEQNVATESKALEVTPENDDPLLEITSFKSYGLPSIRELLRVLISLLNPHDQQHTDRMRLMALSILDVALETGGRSISRINLQQELFLSYLLDRLTPPAFALNPLPHNPDFGEPIRPTGSTPEPDSVSIASTIGPNPSSSIAMQGARAGSGAGSPSPSVRSGSSMGGASHAGGSVRGERIDSVTAQGEVRELLLECLGQFARAPTFMVDLWNAFPDSTTYSASNSHMLCMDSLLLFIGHMVDRLSIPKEEADILDRDLEPFEEITKRRYRKEVLVKGAAKFDENPKAGLIFLESHKMISSLNDPKGVASFLKTNSRLSKKLLGEYLAKPANSEVLKAFIRLFDFHGKRLDESLRELLETFRLPGESQQIERIMELFAETYFATKPKEIASQDAAFILGYAVVMLNTDQHNRGVKGRMSIEQFKKNLRGVNKGEDFPPEYLLEIFEAIRKREIVLPQEHEGQLGFNYAWKELLHRAETAGLLVVSNTSMYDRELFVASWKPIMSAISYAFNVAQDDVTLQKALTGYYQCAILAAHFQLPEIFDRITTSLCRMTGLLDTPIKPADNRDVVVDGATITVSDLAVQFGKSYKGQLAAVVAFGVANEHGNMIRTGWKPILEIIKNLFVNSLLPGSMLEIEDFLAGTTMILLKEATPQTPEPKDKGRQDSSLLSTLSSYLLSSSYSLEELFGDIRLLDDLPLTCLMEAIKFVADGHSVTRTSKLPTPPKLYNPASVFFLELMISLTIQNKHR